jgi:hypothetical protein
MCLGAGDIGCLFARSLVQHTVIVAICKASAYAELCVGPTRDHKSFLIQNAGDASRHIHVSS